MAPRFDNERKTIDLAVADLLEAQLLRSLGFANRGGYERLWLGQAIHSRYQEEALGEDASYRREVTISHRFVHRGYEVTVHGRIDGLRRNPGGGWVIEEIKSVRRGVGLSPAAQELYQRQAALYGWLLAHKLRAEGEASPHIEVELVLIEIGSDRLERQPVELKLPVIEALVKRRLNGLIRAHQQAAAARDARRRAAAELRFPYPEMRRGQERIVERVREVLADGSHLLLEAPTGIGKTVAALFPALRHVLRHDRRLFVLTAKTLQQEMATEVLELLNQDDAFRALRLRAKAKMCANDQLVCHEEYCDYAKDYYAKLQESGVVLRLLEGHRTLLPDDVFAAARRALVCPFEVSLELAERAQVTVCDYNYAFDPYVALSAFHADADLSDVVVIVDEIHNLVARGRGYYSPLLSARDIRRAAAEAAAGGAPIHHRIAELCLVLARLIEGLVDEVEPAVAKDDWAVEQRFPEDGLWRLRPQLDQVFVDYLEFRRETHSLSPDDRFVEQYFGVLKFLNALTLSDGAFSHFVERRGEDRRWRILCKDPSRFLGAVINRCHSVVGLSATLSPHAFYRDLLGFDRDRTERLSLPSPFPPENRRVVIDSSVATTYRERPRNYPRIAERLARFADEVPGNCLALFPSYAFLAQVAGLLRCERKRVLVQARSDSDEEREAILQTLRSALLRDVLLLAVAGGVFAEGVDYPGDMLKAVAVVGPCLPAVTLEQQLLMDYYEERFERGFEYAYVVPGMTRVVQAAGRLIRSADDVGVIALFDKRFLFRTYRQHLPADWLPQDGGSLAGDPAAAAAEFFHALAGEPT